MNWVLRNPEHFKIIHGYFFENEDIKFVYDVIRNEYLSSSDKIVPSKKEIFNLVKLRDKEERVTGDFIKALLKIDFKEYRDEFVIPRFKAWALANSTITGLVDSYETVKNLDKTDLSKVEEAVSDIRMSIDDALNIQLDKGSIGLDFDDPEAHNQDLEVNKIPSGYECFDTITEGGWDRKTFNVLMGGPGSGKSLWLQNLGVNAVNFGYNVAYITLELSDKKCLKRIGAMRLDIPIAEYTERAKDPEYMKERINAANSGADKGGIFQGGKPGKLFIKEYPSGTATISDIEKYIKQVKEEAGIDVDLLVIDYIQIMGTEKGVDRNMLYLKGEHLSIGLRAIAQKYNLACLTATQISKEKYGANNIELNDIPESKAIADTADMVWAIILTPLMKMEGAYHLKPVKLRDCSTDYDRIGFQFNKKTLKVHTDHYIESQL